MKIINTHTIFFTLILHFYYSSPYTLPDHHFINCGSTTTTSIDGRNFTGDTNSKILRLNGRSTVLPKDPNPNPQIVNSPLYQTTRRFNSPSSYTLHTPDSGYYFVRFHFYPLLSLSGAQFNLSVYGVTLLHNFSISNSNGRNSPVIKEFLLNFNSSEDLVIQFNPIGSSFAFVNAIEVFITPEKQITEPVLRTIYRINVGGSNLSRAADTLLRNWVADDYYLYNQESARNSSPRVTRPNYQQGKADDYTAPDIVYQTAKQLNIYNVSDMQRNGQFNMTWTFDVAKNAPHFVRAHFCDIMNVQTDEYFYIFIDGNNRTNIYPNPDYKLAAPFYKDFRFVSDDSGHMNVSIGPSSDANFNNVIPFLNGIEIMEIMSDLASSVMVGPRRDRNNHLFVIIGSAVGGAVSLILILLVFFLFKCKRVKKEDKFDPQMVHVYGATSYGANSSKTGNSSSRGNRDLNLKLGLDEIMYATSNFNPNLMIGKGGFGKVYKGILKNGKKVAVKRSEPGHGQGLSEFETEITVLSKIRHINLVSLIGYCDESSEMILVYEFMENGTLQEHLYGSNKYEKLSWDKRVEICIGAAKGIHYLHTCLDGGIIHRDLKSTNILLDEKYVAKVADFGISRLGPPDHSHVSTAVKGTYGYLDPEYFHCFQLTRKSDVYSFGVVLLEVLCARPAISQSVPYDEVNLSDWAILSQKKGELEKIVDPFLVGKIEPNSLRKFGETVEKCLRDNGAERPDIVDVMWDLEYVFQLQQTDSVVRGGNVDDSVNIDESWGQLALPHLVDHGLNSFSVSITQEDHEVSYNANLTNASGVFSQLKIDDAR